MNKNVKRTLLAVMVSSMLAASFSAIPVAADDTSVIATSVESEGVTDQILPLSTNVASVNGTEYATFANAWTQVCTNGGTLTLLDNASYDQSLSLGNKQVEIDLNGHSLSINTTLSSEINNNASLTIKNGSISYTGLSSVISSAFNIQAGCSVSLQSVQMNTNGSALFPQGNAASVTVDHSNISAACYCVATNAATVDNYNVIINLTNSTFTSKSSDGDNTAIMINIPGIMNIDKCTVTADRQAVLVRGGTVNITESELISTGAYADGSKYLDGNWGSGNEVPNGGLIVGNRDSSSYSYKSTCTITDTTISASGTGSDRAVYVYGYTADNDSTISFTGGEITGGVVLNNESSTELNGTEVNGSISANGAATATVDKDSHITGNVSGSVTVSPLAQVDGTNNSSISENAKYTVNIYVDGTLVESKADQTWEATVALLAETKVGYTQAVTEEGTTISIHYARASYDLTVNNEKFTRKYGDTVTISTSEYYNGHVFKNWVVSSGNVTLANPYSATTTFVMPAANVTVYAVYDEVTFVPVLPEQPTVTAPARDGWVKIGARWYLYDNGEKLTGWQKDGNTWYYLDEKGIMLCGGLTEIDGQTYYFYDWGGMASSWWYEDEDGNWFYFRGNGAMATSSWIEWKGEYYYVGADGKMLTNTTTPDGYRVDANGVWVR